MFKRKLHDYDYFSSEATSDIDANERFKEKLDFLGLTQARRDTASYLKDIYLEEKDFILDNFYDRLLENEEFKKIIHQHSTVERLKKTFDKHFLSLFEDALDLTYVFRRRKIAYTHARIGVLPNWMISAYTLINQIVIPLIAKKFYNEPKKMLDTMLVYDSLVTIDQQIIVETYIEIQASSVVTGLGRIIKYNTELDQIKELIQFQENQETDVIKANSSMEQLNQSIEEIAGTIEDITDTTQNSFEKLNQDIEALQQVSALLQNTDVGQNAVQADVHKLVDRVNSVAKLMGFIKGIADQTNLLALNASIEAARAGEAGKGFAVVADEVRKLADSTKSSVESINQDIHQLKEITNNIKMLTEQSAQDLHEGVSSTLHISQTLSSLNEALQQQGTRFEEISNSSNEQASAANYITNSNQSITKNTTLSKETTIETGAAIYQLSKMIDEYRTNTISKNFILSQEDIIELTITDHLLWRWRVYNLLLGFEQMDEEDITSHRDSRLGQWYYGMGKELLGNEPAYTEIEQPHEQVHEMAKKAVHAYNEGNKKEAEAYLSQLEDISINVIEKLSTLKQIIMTNKNKYQN